MRRIVNGSATIAAAGKLAGATESSRRPLLLDPFGLRMLYPTLTCGRTWFSKWDNGYYRVLTSGQRDPYDPEFIVRGDDGPPYNVTIDGNGLAKISGDAPRLYVYDPKQIRKWWNVEITFYGQRVGETHSKSSQGFVAGARSEHQNSNICPCAGQTYYGRMLYDGRINFQREVVYEGYFSTNKPSESSRYKWPGGMTIPAGLWVGYKFVVRNIQEYK